MEPNRLTERQKQILGFISHFTDSAGWPPTLKEIAGHFGVFISTIQDHVAALERKGALKREKDMARGFRVLSKPDRRSKEGLPILGSVPAGVPAEALENPEERLSLDGTLAKDADFFLRIKGDSMEPELLDGDLVIVRKVQTAEDGDLVVARIDQGDATAKRFRRTSREVWLEPANAKYKPIREKPFTIIGRIVGMARAYR